MKLCSKEEKVDINGEHGTLTTVNTSDKYKKKINKIKLAYNKMKKLFLNEILTLKINS